MAVETSSEDHRHSNSDFSTDEPASGSASDSRDMERYGVWVKAGPVDIGDDEDVSQYKMEDLAPESADGTLTQEEEELLGSLESEESVPSDADREGYDVGSLPESGDAEGDELAIENLDLSSPDESAYNDEYTDVSREERQSLDDISGFELDLADSQEEEESMAIPEESASILQKIESDLLSIKDELTALKKEIFSLRSGGRQPDSEEQHEETESGFFEEDEDETIALTGDELDNILNTADITEQTGQSTASPEDTDFLMEENPDQDIIDRDDVLSDVGELGELEQPSEAEPLSMDEGDLGLDESLADLASVTETPSEELTLDEETVAEETEMLDLPEEEEIVFEEPGETHDLTLDQMTSETAELEPAEEGEPSDLTFELDEDLELSPTETQDMETTEELQGEEELETLSEPDLDETELTEMESEAHETAPEETANEAEETIDEAFDLTDEDLKLPEIEGAMPESPEPVGDSGNGSLPDDLKSEIRAILKYMDQLLESLPEDKIEEFANSEYFDVYKRLFEELGLAT